MTITAQVDEDIKCVRKYFQKLFILLQEAIEEDKNIPMITYDVDTFESQATYFRINYLIKPDMVINIYSLIDFWMKEICKYQKKRNSLNLGYNDIKGSHDLDVFQKYLTKVVGMNLNSVSESYKHLDKLRIVRNKCIHGGGHILDEKEIARVSAFGGITVAGTLMVISDQFIWNSIDHARTYLFEAAKL